MPRITSSSGYLYLISFLALTLCGCARSKGSADRPSPDDARQEIARLWDDIERIRDGEPDAERIADRDRTGDSDGDHEAGSSPDDGETASPEEEEDHDDDHDEDGESVALSEPAAAGAVRARSIESTGRSARRAPRRARLICEDGDRPNVSVCRDSCKIAQSICDNAVNICRLADELGDDEWARGKCGDAREACSEATESCCGCSAP